MVDKWWTKHHYLYTEISENPYISRDNEHTVSICPVYQHHDIYYHLL